MLLTGSRGVLASDNRRQEQALDARIRAEDVGIHANRLRNHVDGLSL
jgi:hypothetical protein